MSLVDLVKSKTQSDTASVETERERVKGLLGLKEGMPFKLHESIDKYIMDGSTVDQAKIALFDLSRSVPAAPVAEPAKDTTSPEPGPIATAQAPNAHAPVGTFSETSVKAYMKTHDVTLEEAVAALAPKAKV